jgi:starch synthase
MADYNPAMGSLRIAFLASELTPFAKAGGLADVAESLGRALGELDHDVRLFVPLYGVIDREAHELEPIAMDAVDFELFRGALPRSDAPVYFVHYPRFYDRGAIYTTDLDEPLRFLFFCRAVLEACQRLRYRPDIVHVNDWQTALVPLLLRTTYAWDELFQTARTVLTIHNLAYQGVFGADVYDAIGVEDPSLFDGDDRRAGVVNFLKTGILHADHLTTVSPTYAREIQTPEQGYHLDGLLRERSRSLTGILNGVDYNEWNPSEDRFIPFRYSEKSLFRKKKNKIALVDKLELRVDEDTPLVGMVTRLYAQKGIDLLEHVLPEMLSREPFALVVLGTGDAHHETFFASLQRRFPERVCFHRGFNNELAHWIEAAADLFLMPSRYEPCGLNQMYSLKYGTVPVVRKTGGLADSVQLFDPDTGEGTGIVFDHYTPDGVRWALDTALGLYRNRDAWRTVVANGMARDFSLRHQAEQYVAIYRRLLID